DTGDLVLLSEDALHGFLELWIHGSSARDEQELVAGDVGEGIGRLFRMELCELEFLRCVRSDLHAEAVKVGGRFFRLSVAEELPSFARRVFDDDILLNGVR